jgi:hypothetical protein
MLRIISLAATAAGLVALATPALATPVNATTNATAKVRVFRPLQLTSKQNLDLGVVILSGSGTYSATVKLDRTGSLNCDSNSGNVLCQGSTAVAKYNVSGTKSQPVTINAPNVSLSDGAGHSLTLTPDYATSLNLSNSGAPGDDFNIGGSVTVTDATFDGVYTGTFAVTADYQ